MSAFTVWTTRDSGDAGRIPLARAYKSCDGTAHIILRIGYGVAAFFTDEGAIVATFTMSQGVYQMGRRAA